MDDLRALAEAAVAAATPHIREQVAREIEAQEIGVEIREASYSSGREQGLRLAAAIAREGN